MKTQTLTKLERTNSELDDLIEHLKAYSNEQLNHRPAEGVWSVIDVMHHLMRAEMLSHNYVKKKLSYGGTFKKAGLATSWRLFVLNTYLRLPIKFKAPELVSQVHFPEKSDFNEVQGKWRTQRKSLLAFLEELPEEIFDKEIYKHPLAGRVTLGGMVDFFIAHFQRHRKQIYRTIKV
ncbi:MAG: DinB family protein [Bacteroidota bacterium]